MKDKELLKSAVLVKVSEEELNNYKNYLNQLFEKEFPQTKPGAVLISAPELLINGNARLCSVISLIDFEENFKLLKAKGVTRILAYFPISKHWGVWKKEEAA